jgi:alkanesulfonate monooxygenase SsuD/methylene tetrahydromethanopterin reductase-like flavin-dependent oxidoreductase (luciferase family)
VFLFATLLPNLTLPLWPAAGGLASIKRAAECGHNLILDQFASAEMLRERIALFHAESAARGPRHDPAQVVVARGMFVVDNECERAAALERNNQTHARTLSVSRAPDRPGGSHILASAHTPQQQRDSPLIGTPEQILAKLETLSAAVVEYVMLNPAGSRASLRRFAHEAMPHVAAHPVGRERPPDRGHPHPFGTPPSLRTR